MPRNKEQTEQIRAESRKKILDTALQCFAERGFDGCSVSDIAQQAGMSQGNIYWYFKSKKEIFMAVLAEGFAGLGTVMAETASGSGSAEEKLSLFLSRFFTLMKAPGGEEFVAIVMTLSAQGSLPQRLAEFGLFTHQIGGGYHESLNKIFIQGQEEGIFPGEIEADLLSTFLFSFVNGLMLMYPDVWKEIPEADLRQAIRRLLGMKSR